MPVWRTKQAFWIIQFAAFFRLKQQKHELSFSEYGWMQTHSEKPEKLSLKFRKYKSLYK